MNILAAILLLGASGSATASREYDQQISGIVARVAWGAVSDVLARDGTGIRGSGGILSRAQRVFDTAELAIDNKPRTGWRSWAEAACLVGAYAADWGTEGAVEYSYRLHAGRYAVRRATSIRNGVVMLTADAWWIETVPVIGRITREIPIHVTIRITATELDGRTALVGYASGLADTEDFACRIVRRIAERQAAATLDRELAAALRTIEREGLRLYDGSAAIGPVLDRIGAGMRTVGRIRR